MSDKYLLGILDHIFDTTYWSMKYGWALPRDQQEYTRKEVRIEKGETQEKNQKSRAVMCCSSMYW